METVEHELHRCLALVLRNKPKEPLLHLMSHFREKAGLPGTNPVSSAYRIMCLSQANSHNCDANIAEAWRTAGASSSGHVSAEAFLQLLSMLVAALTEELKQQVLALLVPIAQLSPDYATFRAATKSCMLLDLLSTYDPDRSPSDQSFAEAEARKLLTHLLLQRHWFLALQPLESVSPGVTCLSATAAATAAAQERHTAEEQATQLVLLALAATRSSDDG